VGPFEEEEEGISISCNIVRVEGEDPATPDSKYWRKYIYMHTCIRTVFKCQINCKST